MAKLDPRLLGNSYMEAYMLGIVKPPPRPVFYPPAILRLIEEEVDKEIQMAKEAPEDANDKGNSNRERSCNT